MIQVVDSGVNPDQIQKQQIQTLVDKNQKLNGRIQSLKVLFIIRLSFNIFIKQLLKHELNAQIALNYPEIYKALSGEKNI